MQTNNTEHSYKNKDDDGINFRPSPNFKHMKKYLKSKFEESGGASPGATESSSANVTVEEGAGRRRGGGVQPPLPPHPPPPDSPPRAALKVERPDDGYEEPARPDERERRGMCREWARGACQHGDACIFAHKIILSQLHGVYTFCKNYQNTAGCNLPKCKFVHATVFEKEHYYRTGYLPPRTLAHIKEASKGGAAGEPPPAEHAAPPAPLAALPRVPDQSAPSPGPGRDAALAEPAPKRCDNCDLSEFRLQRLKTAVEVLLRSNDDMSKKMAAISMKNARLYSIIGALMKTTPPAGGAAGGAMSGGGGGSGSGGGSGGGGGAAHPTPTINVRNEKEINGLVEGRGGLVDGRGGLVEGRGGLVEGRGGLAALAADDTNRPRAPAAPAAAAARSQLPALLRLLLAAEDKLPALPSRDRL